MSRISEILNKYGKQIPFATREKLEKDLIEFENSLIKPDKKLKTEKQKGLSEFIDFLAENYHQCGYRLYIKFEGRTKHTLEELETEFFK